jgi:peptidoglycan LD-endopeptidase LytH
MIYPLKDWDKIKRGYKFGQKTFYGVHHLGLDLKVPVGTEILAPGDCEVIDSLHGEQGGNTVWVKLDDDDYGRLIMRYMHLRELPPKRKFSKGDVIGHSGNTGKYTKGPHLHIDISRGEVKIKEFGNFIDPEGYFRARVNSGQSLGIERNISIKKKA